MHLLVHHALFVAAGTTTFHIQNLGALTYGLAAIGPGIAIGLVFGHAIEAMARQQAARLREEAREQGARMKADLRAEGEAQKRQLIESAQAEIEADRQQAFTSLRAEIGSLSVQLASKIVGESLEDEARQRRIVDRFLEELESGQVAASDVRA